MLKIALNQGLAFRCGNRIPLRDRVIRSIVGQIHPTMDEYPSSSHTSSSIDVGQPLDAAERVTFTRPTIADRTWAMGITASALGFSILSDELPALRLLILTYSVWAMREWIVHRQVLSS